MIGDPPLLTGGPKPTTTRPFPAVATGDIGEPGGVTSGAGVTLLEGAEGAPVPTMLVAVTVNM